MPVFSHDIRRWMMRGAPALYFALSFVLLSARTYGEPATAPMPTQVRLLDPVESVSMRHIKSLVRDLPTYRLTVAPEQVDPVADNAGILAEVAERARSIDGWLLIESFTEIGKSAADDRAISKGRAERVAEYLATAIGPTSPSVIQIGYGSRYARGMPPPHDASDRVITITLIERRVGLAVAAGIRSTRAVLDGREPPIPGGKLAQDDRANANDLLKLMSTGDAATPAPATLAAPSVTATEGAAPRKSRFANEAGVRAVFIYAPSSPSTYNKLVYREPSTKGTAPAAYDSSRKSSNASMGGALVVSAPAESWRGLTFGARYRKSASFTGQSDFSDADADTHNVKDETRATAVGTWLEIFPLHHDFSPRFFARAGFGVDADYSTVTIKETYLDERVAEDSTETSAAVASKLGVASLRIGSDFGIRLGAMTASVATTVQLPLAEFGRTLVAPGDALAWNEILGHRAAPGAEVAAGLGWSF